MRKQYWTIIQPDGEIFIESWWGYRDSDSAWNYISVCKNRTIEELKKEGWKVVKIWVEIEGE